MAAAKKQLANNVQNTWNKSKSKLHLRQYQDMAGYSC